MSGASLKSSLETWLDSLSVISSPASASGLTPSAPPAGRMIDLSGQVPAPASPSVPPASDEAPTTNATSGLSGSGSSASAALQSSLESRLQARTALVGSTLFRLTWKERVTPLGRRISALRASVPRTSDRDCSSWASPQTHDAAGAKSPEKVAEMKRKIYARTGKTPGFANLNEQVLLVAASVAPWPTPIVNDTTGSTHAYGPKKTDGTERDRYLKLPGAAKLASWGTPTAADFRGTVEQAMARKVRAGMVPTPTMLTHQVQLVKGWPTARATDGEKNVRSLEGSLKEIERKGGPQDLCQAAQLATWGTPAARDYKDAGPTFDTNQPMQNAAAEKTRLAGQARLVTPAAADFGTPPRRSRLLPRRQVPAS